MTNQSNMDEFQASIDATQPAARAPSADADTTATLRNLAAFHLMHGRVENAERFLKIALWINPEDGRSQRMQVHVLTRRGAGMEAARLLVSISKSHTSIVTLRDWKQVGLALLRSGHQSLGVKLLSKKSA